MDKQAKLREIGECNYKLKSILSTLRDLNDGEYEEIDEAAYHVKIAYCILRELVDESAYSILGGEIDA